MKPSPRARAYLRLIDANLNRSREGLRVIEDTARFVLKDAPAYRQARKLRHQLDAATRVSYPVLLRERDSASDAGRTITERGRRSGIKAILAANFRRVEESLRVLEEYGKYLAPRRAPEFKAVRYAAYRLEKRLLVKE